MELLRLTDALRSAGALIASLGASVAGGHAPAASAPDAQEAPRGLTVRGDTARLPSGGRVTVVRRGEAVVFRAEVERDGRPAHDVDVRVRVAHGPTLPMARAARGAGHFVSTPWTVPMSCPTGPVAYSVTAEDRGGGAVATWSPFPAPRTALTVVPYPYAVQVQVTPLAHAVQVAATVTRSVALAGSRVAAEPMSAGGAVASIGFDHNVGAGGVLRAMRSTRLTYEPASGMWTGLIATAGLVPGLYVVQVRAQDLVATPNAGTGLSDPFNLARGA